MPTHIGFLRAVNVGKRGYPMAELRQALTEAGFEDVETHIQTGNVKVRSTLRSRAKVEAALERVFAADRGFDVATIVFTAKELAEIADDADELADRHQPGYGHYVSLLKGAPTAVQRDELESASITGERLVVRGRAVHLLYDVPYGEAKLSNAFVEKAAGVATNRNATVIRALKAKWCDA